MTFKENVNRICKENNTNLTTVMKNLGVSPSKVTSINNGFLPKEDMMVKMAKELNCSVMDFFVDDPESNKYYSVTFTNLDNGEERRISRNARRYLESMSKQKAPTFLNQNLEPCVLDSSLNEDEQDVINIFREMPRSEKHKLLAQLYTYREEHQNK